MDELFTVESTDLPEGAALVGFSGREELSTLFRVEVFIRAADAAALEEMTGKTLTLHCHREPAHKWHGMICEVQVLAEMPTWSIAQLSLVPRVHAMDLSHHSRMFTGDKAPDVIKKVLEGAGFADGTDFEIRVSGDYAAEEHICQYKESDLAFIRRWMEHEGMYFYFEHGDKDKLVIVDDPGGHEALAPEAIRYHPVAGADVSAKASFRRFTAKRTARATGVTLRDYDYADPALDVSGEKDADAKGFGKRVLHDERFFAPGSGKRLAKVRAEEELCEHATFEAEGMAFHMRAGYRFELEGHAIGWLNDEYLCTAVEHYANLRARDAHVAKLTGLTLDETYRARVRAIAKKATYRAPRRTPKPRVHGWEAGIVGGASESDYAQLDDQGRYVVRLMLDESDLSGEGVSTRLRMMQPHAGNPEGWHFPLRSGTEVMVGFLDGDPDRPLIVGAIPNAHNPSVVTSNNHTRNVIHTGSDNRFEFEDQDDGQWIDINCPVKGTYFHLGKPHNPTHNFEFHTAGDTLFKFGTNQDINVGGKLEEHVVKKVEETYKAKQTTTIDKNHKATVTGGVTETYKNTQYTYTAKQVTENYNNGQDTNVCAKPRKETFLNKQNTEVLGANTVQTFNGSHSRVVLGPTTSSHTTLERDSPSATYLFYDSTVKRTWGPVTAEYDSLNWRVPGGIDVTCPTLRVTIPGDNWSWLTDVYFIGFDFKLALVELAAVGTKFGITGLTLGQATSKIEVGGFQGGFTALGVGVSLVKGKTKAIIGNIDGAIINT